ncbi:MAG: DMT family transporter [Rickettsiales bacterium]
MISKINLSAYSWKIINILSFVIVSLITKSFIHECSIFEIFFILKFTAMVITFLIYKKNYSKNPKIYTDYFSVSRAIVNICALTLWFLAIRKMDISDATILSYTTPVFGILIGILLFKEKSPRLLGFILLFGFLGCYTIIKPSFKIFPIGLMAALGSALLWAVHDSIIKMQSKKNHPILESMFQSTFLTSLLSLPFAIKYWSFSVTSNYLLLLLCGVLSFINLFSLGKALKQAKLTYLMPISFLRVLFTTLGGYLFYNEIIGLTELVGYAFIVLSNYILVKSKQ